jgi:hypothetical protein
MSSVSADTVSWRACAPSSRSTCGSLLSSISANSGFCRSLATRSLRGTSSTTGSTTTGATWCSFDLDALLGHHLLALARGALPERDVLHHLALLAAATRARHTGRLPMRSASRPQEKRNASAQPATPSMIASRPEPVKPSQRTASGPSIAPSTPPLCPAAAPRSCTGGSTPARSWRPADSARPIQKPARPSTGAATRRLEGPPRDPPGRCGGAARGQTGQPGARRRQIDPPQRRSRTGNSPHRPAGHPGGRRGCAARRRCRRWTRPRPAANSSAGPAARTPAATNPATSRSSDAKRAPPAGAGPGARAAGAFRESSE